MAQGISSVCRFAVGTTSKKKKNHICQLRVVSHIVKLVSDSREHNPLLLFPALTVLWYG